MPEVVFYRKYRPQEFEECLGQEHIVSALQGSFKQGNVSHAYLFSGSRGTGKTSFARILAKTLGTTANDLYEIDAASNRGIDDVRALREAVYTLPLESKYKIYIVDEAHMMTKEAFNALLKTLEEPPPHVIFVLATTEIDRLPETIISRCEVHTFKKPSVKTLRDLVLNVAKKEGKDMEKSAAELVALLGDGSFRDTHGILQKIVSSFSGKVITEENVRIVSGVPKKEVVNDLLSAVSEKDVEKGLQAVACATEENIDMKTYVKLILHKMRLILLLRFAKDLEKTIKEEVSEEDFEFLKGLAMTSGSNVTSSSLLAFLESADLVGKTAIPQLPIELAVIKSCGV
ncbi:MAG: DNA polymerase III subunit gamma/tau [bacterium]|nr:DNA polymerase III subunit gamma/tau [bacterium]